jgi:hypothetical protein
MLFSLVYYSNAGGKVERQFIPQHCSKEKNISDI